MAIFKKQVENSTSIKKEHSTFTRFTSTPSTGEKSNGRILFTEANRTEYDNKSSHLFNSFKLPAANESLLSSSTLSLFHPEFYQLNVDKAVFIEIQNLDYSEFINGKSIKLQFPNTAGTQTTVYSTFYSISDGSVKTSNSALLGDNVSFLFSDDINKPYTGKTDDGANDLSNVTTWGDNIPFEDRPAAVAYLELDQNDKSSDTRSGNYAVPVPVTNYPNNLDSGYNYDVPVGFASLNKGYLVITHPEIVNSINWTAATTNHIDENGNIIPGAPYAAGSDKTDLSFTGSTGTFLSFEDVDTNYTTSVLCLALPREFFISTNPTWDLDRNLVEIENQTYDTDDIQVTQVGLYNIIGELIAVAKLSEPVLKTYSNILTFSLNLEV